MALCESFPPLPRELTVGSAEPRALRGSSEHSLGSRLLSVPEKGVEKSDRRNVQRGAQIEGEAEVTAV
jgi:hypothetical protein